MTVVEFLDRIVPGMDTEVATAFQRILQKQGIKFRLSHEGDRRDAGDDGVTLTVEPVKGGAAETIEGRHRAGRRSAAARTPRGWAWKRPASNWTTASGSRSIAH